MSIYVPHSNPITRYPPRAPLANTRLQTQTANPYTPTALLNGFRQLRGSMNCVTVAGIKAAMQRFGGPNEVYWSVKNLRRV